jgi:hypothetical protein
MIRTKKRQPKTLRRGASSRRDREPHWVDFTDEQLLDMRICDLGVRIEQTRLEQRIGQLYRELQVRGLRFRPHCWFSDEWFTPDGVPGIAIPFYLAHPRLERLERKQMLEVEGGSKAWCMRILRHEAGHAIDNAYRLGRRLSWQRAFGNSARPYPAHYSPKPYSKSYVQHLDMWYAQAHPAEDFAETFAVWLKPRSPWRTQYDGWPAMKKLEYVDHLMVDVSRKRQQVVTRKHIDSARTIKKTLREHYEEKKDRYGVGHSTFYDRDLLKLFSDGAEHRRNPAAAVFLKKHRRYLRQAIGEWTGQYQYTIDQVLNEMIDRCRQLKLRLRRSERHTKRDSLVMLTVQTMNYLHGGHHRVAL